MYKDTLKNRYYTVSGNAAFVVEAPIPNEQDKTGSPYTSSSRYRWATITCLSRMYEEKVGKPLEFKLEPRIEEVVSGLRKKKPEWRYKATRVMGANEHDWLTQLQTWERTAPPAASEGVQFSTIPPLVVCGMEVYDGDEHIGDIRLGARNGWGEKGYCFTNQRIANSRERGGSFAFSKNPKIVVSRVTKSFYVRTPNEHAAPAESEIAEVVYMHQSRAARKHTQAREILTPTLFTYLMDNYDELMGKIPELAEHGYREAVADYMEAQAFNDTFKEGGGYLLITGLERGMLLVRKGSGLPPEYITKYEDLPDKVQQNLGILKLAPLDTPITGVGCKTIMRGLSPYGGRLPADNSSGGGAKVVYYIPGTKEVKSND